MLPRWGERLVRGAKPESGVVRVERTSAGLGTVIRTPCSNSAWVALLGFAGREAIPQRRIWGPARPDELGWKPWRRLRPDNPVHLNGSSKCGAYLRVPVGSLEDPLEERRRGPDSETDQPRRNRL